MPSQFRKKFNFQFWKQNAKDHLSSWLLIDYFVEKIYFLWEPCYSLKNNFFLPQTLQTCFLATCGGKSSNKALNACKIFQPVQCLAIPVYEMNPGPLISKQALNPLDQDLLLAISKSSKWLPVLISRLQRNERKGDKSFAGKKEKAKKFSFRKEIRFNPSCSNFWGSLMKCLNYSVFLVSAQN